MKVAGIFPQEIAGNFLDTDSEESLGIEYILAVAEQAGHKTKLFIPSNISFAEMTNQVIAWQPDVVGIQLFTKHMPIGLSIAKAIKRVLPQTIIVAGGPHPSAVPEIVLGKSIDFSVIGEGEQTFVELLSAIEGGLDYNTVRGISFKTDGRLIITGSRQRIEDLDSLPFPTRDRRFYKTNTVDCTLLFPPPSESVGASILASRGCPSNCYFCSSPSLWQRVIRHRSAQEVVKEIRLMQEQFDVNFVFFEDLSFSLGSRQKVLELCQEIIRQKIKISWWCETNVGAVDKNLLKVMKQAGCHTITFGVESLDDESLKKMRKAQGQTFSQIQKSVSLANEAGMLVWGVYIIGFPWETKESILTNAQMLPRLGIHRLRVSIATPLPGSQWYREIDKSLLNPDLSLYNTDHLVYEHPTITPEEAKELQHKVCRMFYYSPAYWSHVQKTIKRFPYFSKSFEEFLCYVYQNV